MFGENSPYYACDQILFSLKMSRLNYLVNETPYSAYITIRKKFIKDDVTTKDTLSILKSNDKEAELRKME